jgi:hypothetical protein
MQEDENILKLKSAREKFLEDLDNPAYSTEGLEEAAQVDAASLFEPYQDLEGFAINEDKSIWHKKMYSYYVRQKTGAARNFSEIRWRHLLTMREYFRQQGYDGFVPKTSNESPARQPKPAASPIPERSHDMKPDKCSDELSGHVEKNDLHAVRVILRVNEIGNMRLSQQDLLEIAKWIKSRMPGIFAPHEEKHEAHGINRNEADWTASYYYQQMVRLENNFSEERFLHVLQVRESLRKKNTHGFAMPKDEPKASSGNTALIPARPSGKEVPRTRTPAGSPRTDPVGTGIPLRLKCALVSVVGGGIGGAIGGAIGSAIGFYYLADCLAASGPIGEIGGAIEVKGALDLAKLCGIGGAIGVAIGGAIGGAIGAKVWLEKKPWQ